MARYTGLPEELHVALRERDNHRCRWCGATNRGTDAHHIEYRRGFAYDRLENLISLCRLHHGFVHGTPLANGDRITKKVAQEVLFWLVDHPGTTGAARWRSLKRQWMLEGRCLDHGEKKDECLYCPGSPVRYSRLAADTARLEGTPPPDCTRTGRLRDALDITPLACVECGNDDPAEGYDKCTDCLEEYGT